jgi:methanogenic corrinoid protein MtbC1
MHEIDGYAEFPVETSKTMVSRLAAAEAARVERTHREWIAEVVEAEVLPRLLDAHGVKQLRGSDHLTPYPADPDRLVAWLREGRVNEAWGEIEARLRSGVPPLTVMIEDLSLAARKLGSLWDNDECDIVDVSLGLGVLHGMLREITPVEPPPKLAPSILIALTPGETHAFGARMVEIFFRTAGWRTNRADGAKFGLALNREWYDAIGFSLSCERYIDSLERAVCEARAASRNPRLKILVGGPIFGEKPSLANKIGADLFAPNAEAAINLSRVLLEELV